MVSIYLSFHCKLLLTTFLLVVSGIENDAPFLCQRIGHQSTVKGNGIYAFGGYQSPARFKANNESLPSNPELGDSLFFIDTSKTWDYLEDTSQFSIVNAATSCPSPTKPLIGGALFQGPVDADGIYLYGGARVASNDEDNLNVTLSTVPDQLWTFSTGSSCWLKPDSSANSLRVSRHSAYAEAPDQSLAFYLDIEGMSIVNTSTRTLIHVISLPSNVFRIGSQIQYIADLGTQGALILLGGAVTSGNHTVDGTLGDLAPMSTIDVFDIATLYSKNQTWYEQQTTGRTPEARVDFCISTAIAPDKSSYNIYMYGGRSQSEAYADVWALSLPQFHWTKVVKGTTTRFGHTCHLIGSKQMIILGGLQDRGASELGYCAPSGGWLRLVDMTSLQWTSTYINPDPAYQVPRAIVEWIGGSVHGNASMTRPAGDFASQGLAKLFGKELISAGGAGSGQVSGAQKSRNHTPWGPALLFTYLVLAIVGFY